MSRPPLIASVLCCALMFAPAAAHSADGAGRASASPATKMLAKINAARAAHGLPAVHPSRTLTARCRSYARRMARTGQWRHARNAGAAEILAYTRRGPQVNWTVRAWLGSPVHRRVLLGSRYRRVGIAMHKGRIRGGRANIWVVRFTR